MWRSVRLALTFGAMIAAPAGAQDGGRDRAPVIGAVVVRTHNVFDSTQARSNILFRIANAIHVTTLPGVVRQELLFGPGERYDSALVAETLRNLRGRGLFRDVWVDTTRTGDTVDVHLYTADGWTTQLILNANSTADTLTWAVGVQELNFLGTGARVGITYRQEANRSAVTLLGGLDRIGGTRFGFDGLYDDLSDGAVGIWRVGAPFTSLRDPSAFGLSGASRDQRVLLFNGGSIEEIFRRRLLFQRATVAFAPRASQTGYVRVGASAQIKREGYLLEDDLDLAIPDTVTGAAGVFVDVAKARFKVLTHYNGFDRDVDLDLSPRVALTLWLAPEAFGYARTGIAPSFAAQIGTSFGRQFARLDLRANGLFTSAGMDSGQVWVGFTAASQALPKQATVVHFEAGAQDGVAPGEEFTLGNSGTGFIGAIPVSPRDHGVGPRAFEPNAFTGTRMFWASLEHRIFLLDEILGLLGLGLAAYVDYGGAWFAGESSRIGGNIGGGIRFGSTRSAGPNIGRLDLAYRFGDGTDGRRWVVSFGRGFPF